MYSPLRLGAILLVYNLLLPVALLLSLPGYIVKMVRRGGHAGHLSQRFGIYPAAVGRMLAQKDRPVWVHAVSVGEVLIAAKMIREWQLQPKAPPVVLSTTTSTGYAVARERLGGRATVIYNPLDFPWVVWMALRKIDPSQLVLVEAEVWPNLVCAARWMGIPVNLINARLSERSERRLARFGFLVRPIYAMLSRVLVQSEDDAPRLERIGVRAEAIQRVGSIKYDPEGMGRPEQADVFSAQLSRLFGGAQRPVALAGSTHAGEEELIGGAVLKAAAKISGLFYIVAPRHFERCDRLAARLREVGLRPLLRSEMEAAPDGCCAPGGDCDTLIVNTTGELRAWYFTADVVVIGKSFLSTGGQNPVEAILADKPVITGPDMKNFASLVRDLEKRGGIRRVADAAALTDSIGELLAQPAAVNALTCAARAVLSAHEGATRRTVAILLGLGRNEA